MWFEVGYSCNRESIQHLIPEAIKLSTLPPKCLYQTFFMGHYFLPVECKYCRIVGVEASTAVYGYQVK